jgi:hypothetical protein
MLAGIKEDRAGGEAGEESRMGETQGRLDADSCLLNVHRQMTPLCEHLSPKYLLRAISFCSRTEYSSKSLKWGKGRREGGCSNLKKYSLKPRHKSSS